MTVLNDHDQHPGCGTATGPAAHQHWCEEKSHEFGEPCESISFVVETDAGTTYLARILQTSGGPRIIVDATGPAAPYTMALELGDAHSLADFLMELRCVARVCDCQLDEKCPGNVRYLNYQHYMETS